MTNGEFYRRDRAWHPRALTTAYRSTALRSPRRALLSLADSPADLHGPVFGQGDIDPLDHDLIRNFGTGGEAIGERIVVHGRVIDQNGKGVPHSLIEIWQANAGGRYRHVRDSYQAPLDPNFGGCGRVLTDAEGNYAFRTIKPGPYPVRNNGSDWRPAHIHLSLFGNAFAQRLITQFYFEGDPLIPKCAIANTIADPAALETLIAKLDLENQGPFDHLTYRFDIVLRGRRATFFEGR
jgi:protocatechuate 3,4-dioxygenase beta subunit